MHNTTISHRAEAIAATAPLRLLESYLIAITQDDGGDNAEILDFTFGDPREIASDAYVAALREAAVPQDESWFAYTWSKPEAQQAAASSLGHLTGIPFEPDDILLTNGGFAALSTAVKLVADPGDEAIFSLPP